MDSQKYSEITKLIRQERVTLFIGSGCSPQAPSVGRLTELLFDSLPAEYQETLQANHNDLAKISGALVSSDGGKAKRDSIILNNFSGLHVGEFHKKLACVSHIHSIITTNYDTLIEDAFGTDGISVIRKDYDCTRIDDGKVNLFKIHGDVEDIDDIILTSGDYRNEISQPRNQLVWDSVISEFSKRHIVFVGYSIEDGNILNLIEVISSKIGDRRLQMFMIAPSANIIKRRELEKMGITYVDGNDLEFINATLAAIDDNFADDLRNKVTSLDTTVKYCQRKGMCFGVEDRGDIRKTISWNNLPGNSYTTTINLKTRKLSGTFDSEFAVEGIMIPAIIFTHEDLIQLDIRMNNVKVNPNGDTECMYIMPPHVIGQATLANTQGLRLKARCATFSIGSSSHFRMVTELGQIFLWSGMSNPETLDGITIRLAESFSDIDNAHKWISLVKDCISGVQTTVIANGKSLFSNQRINKRGEIGASIDMVEMYLDNLKKIEQMAGVIFEKYDGFSESQLLDTKRVLSYLSKEAFIEYLTDADTEFSVDFPVKATPEIGKEYVLRFRSGLSEPVLICGKPFNLPEERTLYMRCLSLKNDIQDDGTVKSHFRINDGKVQIEYKDPNDPDIIDPSQVESID